MLGRAPDEPLVYLERLRLADDQPIVLDCSWLPATLARPLLEVDFTRTALYHELHAQCGLWPDAGGSGCGPCCPPPSSGICSASVPARGARHRAAGHQPRDPGGMAAWPGAGRPVQLCRPVGRRGSRCRLRACRAVSIPQKGPMSLLIGGTTGQHRCMSQEGLGETQITQILHAATLAPSMTTPSHGGSRLSRAPRPSSSSPTRTGCCRVATRTAARCTSAAAPHCSTCALRWRWWAGRPWSGCSPRQPSRCCSRPSGSAARTARMRQTGSCPRQFRYGAPTAARTATARCLLECLPNWQRRPSSRGRRCPCPGTTRRTGCCG